MNRSRLYFTNRAKCLTIGIGRRSFTVVLSRFASASLGHCLLSVEGVACVLVSLTIQVFAELNLFIGNDSADLTVIVAITVNGVDIARGNNLCLNIDLVVVITLERLGFWLSAL